MACASLLAAAVAAAALAAVATAAPPPVTVAYGYNISYFKSKPILNAASLDRCACMPLRGMGVL